VKQGSSAGHSSPLSIWLALAGAVITILVIALLGLWAWQQAGEIQALQGEMLVLQGERRQAQARVAALQATASALQQDLARLQASSPKPQPGTEADAGQLVELQARLEEIGTRLDGIEVALTQAVGRVQALEKTPRPSAQPLPSHARLSITPQKQIHNLSCESSAAAMAAQYHGVPLTEAEVLTALPRNDNPYIGFRGNVDGLPGGVEDYGVYAGPILDLLSATGLKAWLVEGGIEGIRAAIAQGHPVIAWITYNCSHSTPVTKMIDGEAVRLVPYQHAVVVTGYSADGVWANDPWDGQEDFYATADFRRALAYFDDMAIEVAAP
jgi:uncharacterized protein YvpB